VGVMACGVKVLDVGGIGAKTHNLGGLKRCLPYGIRFEQTKLQMEALPPSNYMFNACLPVFASNPPSDVIEALVQPTKVFRVSKHATFARG
jgi:hypothetical protein